jgi:small multidrug resistance pump
LIDVTELSAPVGKSMHYLYLALAILGEVIAINALKASEEFTKPIPAIIVVIGYCCTFYFLMLALRVIPVGIAYAIWAGVGIIIVTVGAYFMFKQSLDVPAMLGIALIVLGVVVIQLFSQTIGD